MTDAESIVDAVRNNVTLAGLIDGRIYPVVLPPDPDLPAVTYQLISQPTSVTQEGTQYRSPRWRLRIYSLLYGDLIPIAQALAGVFGNQANTRSRRVASNTHRVGLKTTSPTRTAIGGPLTSWLDSRRPALQRSKET